MARDPIVTAFEDRLRAFGDEIVVTGPGHRATRCDIDALARSLEGHFPGPAALPPGSLVGLAVADGPGFLAALLALRRARCAAILFDAKGRPEDHREICGRLGGRWMFASREAWPASRNAFRWTAVEPPAPSSPGASPVPSQVPETVAVLKLTSGSTGAPRGILTPSGALLADDRALAATMGLGPEERILAAIPFSHSYGLSSVAIPALTRGNRLILPEEGNPFSLLKTGHWGEATFLPTVPAYLQALVKMSSPPAWPPSLRLVISAGAPLRPDTAEAFRHRFGQGVHVFYGSSETGGITYDRLGDAAERGTLGTPVDGVSISLDGGSQGLAERGPYASRESPPRPPPLRGEGSAGGFLASPVADGDAGTRGLRPPAEPVTQSSPSGLVVVSSAAVAEGYWPERARALGGGRFRTSDLATWQTSPRGEPELCLLGRADDLINVKGKKVRPREIEAVLQELPGVDEAAVLGLAAPGGGQLIRAVLACDPGTLTKPQVLAHCRRLLPPYKVPRSLLLLPALPRTPRGKLDRRALEELKGEG